jgi:hypothetical protein
MSTSLLAANLLFVQAVEAWKRDDLDASASLCQAAQAAVRQAEENEGASATDVGALRLRLVHFALKDWTPYALAHARRMGGVISREEYVRTLRDIRMVYDSGSRWLSREIARGVVVLAESDAKPDVGELAAEWERVTSDIDARISSASCSSTTCKR